MPVLLLGESLHGVREFALYKHAVLEDLLSQGQEFLVVFEADALGIDLVADRPADQVLQLAFPRIFRTQEYRDMVALLQRAGVKFVGMDCRPRVPRGLVPSSHLSEYDRRVGWVREGNFSDDWFAFRDGFMAETVARCVKEHPHSLIVCLTHNLHAKRRGSAEADPRLRLKSLREHLDDRALGPTSVGLFGQQGSFWEVDLTLGSFQVDDPRSFERSVDLSLLPAREIDAGLVNPELTAFHCGTQRESTPVASNYERLVVFRSVSPSSLLESQPA